MWLVTGALVVTNDNLGSLPNTSFHVVVLDIYIYIYIYIYILKSQLIYRDRHQPAPMEESQLGENADSGGLIMMFAKEIEA
jgi:hypothetical protein